VTPDTNPIPGHHVEYRWYGSKGATALLAAGSKANDLPTVTMDGGRDTAQMFRIVNIIELDQTDRDAIKAARAKGLPVPDAGQQYAEAARYHQEDEQKLFFLGAPKHGKSGLVNHPGITAELVALGATGATDMDKRLAANKKAAELLRDFRRAMIVASQGGIFKRFTFVGPTSLKQTLMTKPVNSVSDKTMLPFLKDSLSDEISNWIFTDALVAGNNGLAVDSFLLFEASPRVIKYKLPQDVEMLPPIYDVLQNMQQAVVTKTSGAILLQPAAVYRGDGLS